MTNDIHTRPQGYQGPAFDNEQQREEMQARARQIATTILNQIKAAPAANKKTMPVYIFNKLLVFRKKIANRNPYLPM